MMNRNSHKKINHENFRLNVHGYYSRERNDANAAADAAAVTVDSIADAKDRGHSITIRNTVNNVNSKPTKPYDNANQKKYDESALSRCALLFVGSLCQQGKIVQ